MRRTIAGLVFATFLTTGAASASSFVAPEPMTAKLGPSMILLGEPAGTPVAKSDQPRPAGTIATTIGETPLDYPFPGGKSNAGFKTARAADFLHVSASIIAMAEPEPAVSFEQVAAVDKGADDSERRREFFAPPPTVIRGGVVDNGGSAEVSVPAAPAKKPAAMAPSQTASSSQQQPRQPDAPIPLPTPAPLPANIIPQTKVQ